MKVSISCLLIMLGLLAVPCTLATAVPSEARFPAGWRSTVEFGLPAKAGYRAQVEASGRRAVLSVDRGPTSAIYLTKRATTWRNGLRARFGRFGRIAVRFEHTGKAQREEPPRRCRGKQRVIRFGRYVGTIRFRGERGYVRIDADDAPGTSTAAPRWQCKRRRGSPRPALRESALRSSPLDDFLADSEVVSLYAAARHRHSWFLASAYRPSGERHTNVFAAGTFQRRPAFLVAHVVGLEGEDRAFQFDRSRLFNATVDPPAPFRGSATFQRDAGGAATWSGSLRVYLPGIGEVALAGPKYKAELERNTL